METKPASDLFVDPSLVRGLIHDQHPDLAHLVPLKVAEGWDNVIFRLGDELAVRLPRRVASATLIEQEQRWLPQLSSRLPIPVPVPLRVGVPSPMFGWAWSIVRWLPGQSLLHAVLPDPAAAGAVLERFLHALHQPAPPDAPRNPWRGVPLEARTAALRKHVHQLDGVVDATGRAQPVGPRAIRDAVARTSAVAPRRSSPGQPARERWPAIGRDRFRRSHLRRSSD